MFSNTKRVVTLTLLASAANFAFAAPAPVSDLNDSTSVTPSSSSAPETDVQRLERLLKNRAALQIQMQGQIDDLLAEVGQLRGEVERNSYEMKKMTERQRELFLEIDRLRQLQDKPAVEEAQEPEEGKQGTFTTNQDEDSAYKEAVDLILKQRDYAGAIVAFNEFQKTYPDSKFMPNTHYWLGQLYFANKQDQEAAKSFAAVVAYKESNKRADALLKLGDIAARNNKADVAKKYYQQVVDEHPDTSSANIARKNLK